MQNDITFMKSVYEMGHSQKNGNFMSLTKKLENEYFNFILRNTVITSKKYRTLSHIVQ